MVWQDALVDQGHDDGPAYINLPSVPPSSAASCHWSLQVSEPLFLPLPQVLIREEILPQGDLSDPTGAAWAAPLLELAPGFRAPVPTTYDTMREYIEAALPAESPVVYGMHPNAELSLLTSLGETLFRTVTDVSGGNSSEALAAAGGQ